MGLLLTISLPSQQTWDVGTTLVYSLVCFLANDDNKRQIVKVMLDVWSNDSIATKLHGREVIFICEGYLLKSDSGETTETTEVQELISRQVETDSRYLHTVCMQETTAMKMYESRSWIHISSSSCFPSHMFLISQSYLTPGQGPGSGTGEITWHNQPGKKVHTHVPRYLYGPACLQVHALRHHK